MVRNELRKARASFSATSRAERGVWGIVIGMILLTLGGLINLAPINDGIKFWLFAVAVSAFAFIAFSIYRHQVRESERSNQPHDPPPTTPQRDTDTDLPPQPPNPPTIGVNDPVDEEEVGDVDFEVESKDIVTEYRDDNPSLYRYRFSIVPVVFKICFVTLLWLGFLYLTIVTATIEMWIALAVAACVALLYCYYSVLHWNGEEFVVNEEWYARPLSMPAPFTSKTPAIQRKEIGKYEFKMTFRDKFFGVCRLYSNTPDPEDQGFHDVRWLTHPAELRRATGISAPRKNSYLFWRNRDR